MLFVSQVFLFAFLPLFLLAYAATPVRWRNGTATLFSLVFYGWWRLDLLLLLLATTVAVYAFGRRIATTDGPRRRRELTVAVVVTLGVLVAFKYANWLAGIVAAVQVWTGRPPLFWETILLPMGISFYVFQSLSYLIDVYRRDTPPARDLIDFATYLTFFPQLVAGPIVRYKQIAGELVQRRVTPDGFFLGVHRFMAGFAMKVLIADTLAPLVDAGFASPGGLGFAAAWGVTTAYALQLLFDFAGYSSMAVGLGLMLGLHFPENFDRPYLAASISEFWRRWHMSLSGWLRDYLYIPLGGNRRGPGRSAFNLLATMTLGGLWHGANWTFLLWGLWHGLALAFERAWRTRGLPAPPRLLGHALTLAVVLVGWALFRSSDVNAASQLLQALAGTTSADADVSAHLQLLWQPEARAAALAGLTLVLAPAIPALTPICRHDALMLRALALIGFAVSLLLLLDRASVPFLYFQF